MKIALLVITLFLNMALLYVGEYYPLIIAASLLVLLFFYSPNDNEKTENNKQQKIEKVEREEEIDKINIQKITLVLFAFKEEIQTKNIKETKIWEKLNLKYEYFLIQHATKNRNINIKNILEQFSKHNEKEKIYLINEIISWRNDGKVFIHDKQNDPLIKIINNIGFDFLTKRQLLDKSYHFLLKESPYNERVKKQAKKIYDNIKNIINEAELEEFNKSISILKLNEKFTEQELKMAYKRMLSLSHPDKFPEADEELKKNLHQKVVEIQSSYSYLKNKIVK